MYINCSYERHVSILL